MAYCNNYLQIYFFTFWGIEYNDNNNNNNMMMMMMIFYPR